MVISIIILGNFSWPRIWVMSVSVCLLFISWRYNPLCLYFHNPVGGFSLLVSEVSWPRTSATVGRTPLDEWSTRLRDLYLTTHNNHSRQISMTLVGFEPKNLSRRAAEDLRLRPRDHWNRPCLCLWNANRTPFSHKVSSRKWRSIFVSLLNSYCELVCLFLQIDTKILPQVNGQRIWVPYPGIQSRTQLILGVSKWEDGFGGLVVSMLTSGTQVCGFKPGQSRWIFRM